MTNKKLKAIVTIGAPASGKSTYANTLSWSKYDKLERDEIRMQICTSKEMQLISPLTTDKKRRYRKLDKQTRNIVERRVTDTITRRINARTDNIILSNTNLTLKHRNALVKNLLNLGYEVEVRVFNPELDILLQRDKARTDSVGPNVVVEFWQRLQHQLYDIKDLSRLPNVTVFFDSHSNSKHSLIFNNGQLLDDCIIVDLDGTIAHNKIDPVTGNRARGWYDNDVSGDEFDDVVFFMAYALSMKYNADIVFLTGRSVKAWQSSKEWLDKNLSKYGGLLHNKGYQLYARSMNDSRPDTEVKRDMYDTFIDGRYDRVVAVFDDRPSVVGLWHDLGLKVFALGDQRNEF